MKFSAVWVLWAIYILVGLRVLYILYSRFLVPRNARNEKRALKEVAKTNDQAKLLEIAKTTQHFNVRRAASQKMTDPALIAELVKKSFIGLDAESLIAKINDQDILLDIASNAVNQNVAMPALEKFISMADASGLDEHGWLEIIRSLQQYDAAGRSKVYPSMVEQLFSRIHTYSLLLEYTPPKQNLLFSNCYLSRVIELADGKPEVFMQFQAKAIDLINAAHADRVEVAPGIHEDHRQSVRGVSSDCHNDSIPWVQVGHGYHHDGYINSKPQHRDTVGSFARFKAYFEKDD